MTAAVLPWVVAAFAASRCCSPRCACCAARRCPTASWRSTRCTSTRWRCWSCCGMPLDTALYFEAALVIAMLGFVGTVAMAKYLLRGDIVE